MIDIDFVYCRVIIGTTKLAYKRLSYERSDFCLRKSIIDIISMFTRSYVEF